MNPDLTIGDVIAQIDEEGAFRFFFYTTEEYPLDPGGGTEWRTLPISTDNLIGRASMRPT